MPSTDEGVPRPAGGAATDLEQPELRADCPNCFGLCCVAPAFSKSSDFAMDKPAGRACLNLRSDFRCGIHSSLRESGFAGCTVYDCFGAGQKIAQVTFSGRDWRRSPEIAPQMFAAFSVMRELHEMLWYLREAVALSAGRPLEPRLRAASAAIHELTLRRPADVLDVDVDAYRNEVGPLLHEVSAHVRRQKVADRKNFAGADLSGRSFSGADLRRADFRSARLIGVKLSKADLRYADLLGADLRGADLSGADASSALFLTQFQVNAVTGDSRTKLPALLARPTHWVAATHS